MFLKHDLKGAFIQILGSKAQHFPSIAHPSKNGPLLTTLSLDIGHHYVSVHFKQIYLE